MSATKFSIPKLDGTNWHTWKVRLEMLLIRDGTWYVIEEGIPKEEDQDDDWINDDRKAKATLILLLEDNQFPLVKNCEHAHDVFSALKNYHQKSSRSVRVSLMKKLCSTNLSEHGDLKKHMLEIDDLFDRLDVAGMEFTNEVKVCLLLRSLPPTFDSLVTALDSRPDDVPLETVKSKLEDEMNRLLERKGVTPKVEKAMHSDGGNKGNGRGPILCRFCKKPGHIQRNCRKYLATKDNGNSSSSNESANVKAKAAQSDTKGIAFVAAKEKPSNWVIDSGASAHMTGDKSFFTTLEEFVGGFITVADGNKVQIHGEGCGVLYGVDGEESAMKIDLSKVKYVPGLSTSLISVSVMAQNKFDTVFEEHGCSIVSEEGTVVATGVRYGGLYYLRSAEASMIASESQHKVNCQHQWHRRLGHRDWTAAERLTKESLATGMKVSDCGLKLVCECCMEGKAARLPFPPVTERKAKRVLDIVHTDLCGPMRTTTPSGNRYVLNIIDDYSRFTVTYLQKTKSEAAQNIIDYVRWVQNVFGRKPRVVRSDGGGEFDNKQLRQFYRAKGIKPQFTTPYSPQQNGVAERKNRSLIEMATCMLIDAGMENRFWGEAVLTATYLQNRIPSRVVPKTPYELWWGRKLDLSHVRIFGSKAYVHIPDSKRGKLESKAQLLIFVGYSIEQKAYRFVDLGSNDITISRDARFIELGNGTSSVQVELEESAPKPKAPAEEEIPLIPFKEEPEENKEETEGETSCNDGYDTAEEGTSNGAVRRSTRKTKPPSYLEDYDLEYAVGIAACAVEGPVDFKEAMKNPEWRRAMEDELDSHRRNQTWKLVEPPEGRKIIGSRWVYKVKRDEQNRVVKHKARLVAQGYTQRFGVDFDEVFAPVSRPTTFRALLTVASKHNMIVEHVDFKTAYLNGILEEEVFMRQPPGFTVQGKEHLVCRVQRSIYGLRQSARCWNRRLHGVMTKKGFKQSSADMCLYVKGVGVKRLLLLVYVDDLLVASADKAEIEKFCESLEAEFELTRLGEVRHFLGMEVQRENGTYTICLQNYINKLVSAHGMEMAKEAKSPMDPGYLKDDSTDDAFEDPTQYRSLVGGLLYLAVMARPDIAACTAILGRSFSAPKQKDWTAAKRVLRFLKRTRDYQLQLGGDRDMQLVGYSDSDYAGDPETRRSTSGFVFSFAGGAISWVSRRQPCVTLSSMEAEFVALCEASQEAVWLRQLLRDMGEAQDQPTVLKEDNQGCLAFIRSEKISRRSKHIDTKERYVQELCAKKEIHLEYCPTDQMVADILTKPLGPQKQDRFTGMLGLRKPTNQ